ncbi:MAG TPA: hypothetical protein PKA14_24000 [Leptospiraceae bacterium]|nr:hypothetical protein [Leptospiraceae bacterium]
MKIIYIVIQVLGLAGGLYSFPGDQDSLSCVSSNHKTRLKYIYQYDNKDPDKNLICTQSDPAQKETCIEKNKADAIADVTKAVRSNYDTSKHFTKMGEGIPVPFYHFFSLLHDHFLSLLKMGV